MRLDSNALKERAAGRWREILSALGGIDAGILDGKNHPCPKCGGKDRFRFTDLDGGGSVYCNQCGKGIGDGIAALMWSRGWDFQTALGQLSRHFGDQPTADGKPRIVKTYDYSDEAGRLLYQVCRMKPKDFRQRRPTPGGGWAWSVKGCRQVPYRLPELLKADPTELVFIVEGEKDADRLAALGCVATTNASGAGKWRPEYNEHFRGRRVAVLPDNDDVGRKHVAQVAANVKGIATSVKIVELPGLPEKGDVSDWLDNGGTLEALAALVERAPEWEPGPVAAGKPTSRRRPILPWRPFPVGVLPEPARSYVACGATAMGCEPAYIALPLLALLASAIGATRRVRLKPGWCEPSVLWTAIVADSGTLKSPAANYALDALNKLQAWKLEEYPQLREQYERDKLLYEADLANWKRKGRVKGEPPPEKPDEPTVQRYIVHDITIEALAERLASAPRGLLSANDELGAWLGSFNQYRPSGGADVPRWLSIYRAESLIIDRKTGPVKTIFIKRAVVSVTGGITPVALARALGREHLENGLAARIGLAMPPRLRKRWTEATVDEAVIRPVERVVGRLLALDFGRDANDSPTPIDLDLTPEGKAEWIDFYDEHNEKQEALIGPLASAYSKLEGGAARLALIVQLVRWAADAAAGGAIDGESVKAGIALARWFRYEAERVYAALAETDSEREQRSLIDLVRRLGGTATARDLMRGSRRYRERAPDAEAALNGLVQAGEGRWVEAGSGPAGGRPTRVFQLAEGGDGDKTPENPEENEVVLPSPPNNEPKTQIEDTSGGEAEWTG